jgi:hypothetical protein
MLQVTEEQEKAVNHTKRFVVKNSAGSKEKNDNSDKADDKGK